MMMTAIVIMPRHDDNDDRDDVNEDGDDIDDDGE